MAVVLAVEFKVVKPSSNVEFKSGVVFVSVDVMGMALEVNLVSGVLVFVLVLVVVVVVVVIVFVLVMVVFVLVIAVSAVAL